MLAFFTIVPAGKESVSKDVSAVIDVIARSGIEYRLTSMGTIIEGDPDRVWELVRKCHETMRSRAARVLTNIYLDDREGASKRITGKIEAVEKLLGKKLKT